MLWQGYWPTGTTLLYIVVFNVWYCFCLLVVGMRKPHAGPCERTWSRFPRSDKCRYTGAALAGQAVIALPVSIYFAF